MMTEVTNPDRGYRHYNEVECRKCFVGIESQVIHLPSPHRAYGNRTHIGECDDESSGVL